MIPPIHDPPFTIWPRHWDESPKDMAASGPHGVARFYSETETWDLGVFFLGVRGVFWMIAFGHIYIYIFGLKMGMKMVLLNMHAYVFIYNMYIIVYLRVFLTRRDWWGGMIIKFAFQSRSTYVSSKELNRAITRSYSWRMSTGQKENNDQLVWNESDSGKILIYT